MGDVRKFDFQQVSPRLPRVDLPDLRTFFEASLSLNGRQVTEADGTITLNGVFNDATNMSHDVFKTVPSTSVVRTVTSVHSGQTLSMEMLFGNYALTRAQDGSLTWTTTGMLADGTVPTWT